MINIEIDEKPISVSIRYNGYYKMVLLLAIIKYCAFSNKASLSLIHIVFWSLRNKTNYQVLKDFSDQNRKTLTPWTFEQGIENVLALGLINNFIERNKVQENLNFKITDQGEKVLKSINELNLFKEEIEKIKNLGKISKNRLNRANDNWKII